MEAKFWLDKWSKNEIGFHEQRVHPLLTSYWSDVVARCENQVDASLQTSNVFVPLCGKSQDLLWLMAQDHHVYGIELSEIAVEAFFTENHISFTKTVLGSLIRYEGENITLWCGDYFSLQADMLPTISLFYDRAAFIALAPSSRQSYLEHLILLLANTATGLLIAIEYDDGLVNPPPHSISPNQVKAACAAELSCEPLARSDAEVKGKPCSEHALVIRMSN